VYLAPCLLQLFLLIMPSVEDGVAMSLRPGVNPATAGIPLVIMSARRELREVAQAMHADDVSPEPFDLKELEQVVARWATQPEARYGASAPLG